MEAMRYVAVGSIQYNDAIMSAMASQITSLTIVYSTVYLGTDQRKHQSSASLAFVWGINWWPVNSPYEGPVTQKIFPLDDVIMLAAIITWLRMATQPSPIWYIDKSAWKGIPPAPGSVMMTSRHRNAFHIIGAQYLLFCCVLCRQPEQAVEPRTAKV